MDKLFDFDYMIKSIPQLIVYIPLTIWLTVVSMLLGIIVGLFTALVRIYKVPVLKQLSVFYISFIRGTPLLVQLFLTYYGIPKFLFFFQNQYGWFQSVNINVIPPEIFAVLAFTTNLGAYLSETIRSAIESVERGQFEAAYSIGMTETQIMLKIVLPQALIVALPNLGNTMISTVKDTSLVFTIAITDILGAAKIIGSRTLAYFEVYVAVSLIYWVICILLERILFILERKLKIYERSVVR